MSHTLIFDIGKTNKKLFVFDSQFVVVYQEAIKMKPTTDEDGFECDDIQQIVSWVLSKVEELTLNDNFNITKINFSCYGATLVHLDKEDQVLTPIYNYLKPVSSFSSLYESYGGEDQFVSDTASPALGFLNSGLQLYWLKQQRPEVFERISSTLHFPNYLSFLLHNTKISEYTSIGCHTAMWDYKKSQYHAWVQQEEYFDKLPPLKAGNQLLPMHDQQDLQVGMGLHDSSAALVPYLIGSTTPFAILSTGTWSIFINPYSDMSLDKEHLDQDCLSFLTMSGQSVIASRLFFGHHHDVMIDKIQLQFSTDVDFKKVEFDKEIYDTLLHIDSTDYFSISTENQFESTVPMEDFILVYHQMMYQLVQEQIQKIKLILPDDSPISTIYIDGGFARNSVFCNMLKFAFPRYQWKTSNLAAGSSLGAAIAVNESLFDSSSFVTTLNIQAV